MQAIVVVVGTVAASGKGVVGAQRTRQWQLMWKGTSRNEACGKGGNGSAGSSGLCLWRWQYHGGLSACENGVVGMLQVAVRF